MILHHSHKVLREKCLDATTEGAKSLIPRFVEAWKEYPYAVGIAAPQIGAAMKVFMWDPKRKKKKYGNPEIVINPIIHKISLEGTSVQEEGCLSCPGKRVPVERLDWLTVSYTTESGDYATRAYEGFAARVFQHEYDHLYGKLILDYIEDA